MPLTNRFPSLPIRNRVIRWINIDYIWMRICRPLEALSARPASLEELTENPLISWKNKYEKITTKLHPNNSRPPSQSNFLPSLVLYLSPTSTNVLKILRSTNSGKLISQLTCLLWLASHVQMQFEVQGSRLEPSKASDDFDAHSHRNALQS